MIAANFAATLLFASLAAASDVMRSSVWSIKLQKELRHELCQPKDYTRFCYNLDQEKCETVIEKFTADCIPKLGMPDRVEIFGNGVKLAYRVGSCVAKKVDFKFADQRSPASKCKNAQEWMQ